MAARFLCLLMLLTSLTVSGQDVMVQPVKLLSGSSNLMAPVVLDSVLYFSSDKKIDLLVNYLDQDDNHFYKLYQVPLKNRRPSGVSSLLFPKGQPFHQAAIAANPLENNFLVTQSLYTTVQRVRQSNRVNPLTIVQVGLNAKGNGRAKPMALNVARGNNMAYPALSNDGKTVFFVSDMEGGFGGSDLYFSTKTPEGWSEPTNAGSVVNTPGNENFPFVAASGKIFFASAGRPDSQGMDLYYTYLTDKGFAEPVRLDSLYNSDKDDFGVYVSHDEQWGYLCSNRDGKDQIYYFESLFPQFPSAEPYEEDNLCFSFYESSTENYDTLQFGFRWNFSDGTTQLGMEVDHCFASHGLYKVSLDVFDKVSGEELFTVSDFEMNLTPKPQVGITMPVTVKKGEMVTFSADASSIEGLVPTGYFWQIGPQVKLKGQVVSHLFPEAGSYMIHCGVVDANNPDNKVCTYREIVVVD